MAVYAESSIFTALLVLGTRPEVIKLAPVHKELSKRSNRFRVVTCVTGQHRELLDQMLQVFSITPDIDLNIIKRDQTLYHLTTSVLTQIEKVLVDVKPHITIVQGDTSSAFTAALGSFYAQIPVAHVEAGLRSYDKFQPFPEEINRTLISHIADLNFCPTQAAAKNLSRENVKRSSIIVTGNTVIDALLYTVGRLNQIEELEKGLDKWEITTDRMILVTGHRRENFGRGIRDLSHALVELSELFQDIIILYSLHPNPNVQEPVKAILSGHDRIEIISPPDYVTFVKLMKRSFLLITDSGGIQEEAPSLRKPVLVTREVTERPEAVECGAAKLVGTNKQRIVHEASKLLKDDNYYQSMIVQESPFGDGHAAERIVDGLDAFLRHKHPD